MRPLIFVAVASVLAGPAHATPWLRTFGMTVTGEPVTLRVSGLTPGGQVAVVAGTATAPGATCPPGAGLCVDVVRARLVARGTAAANGALEATVVVPDTLAPGSTVVFQAVDIASGTLSAVASRTVLDHLPVFGVWDTAGGPVGGPIEIDDQGTVQPGLTTTFADFDPVAGVAFETWQSPSTWFYWARLDWTWDGGWWLCRSVPSSNELVIRTQTGADRTDPATGGCHGGPWTALSPAQPEVAGAWSTAGGAPVTIDAAQVSWARLRLAVERFSNVDHDLVVQDGLGGWHRLDWTWDASGDLWVCPAVVGARSSWAARVGPRPDAADLAAGCRTGPWFALVP